MPRSDDESNLRAQIRKHAEARLESGTAPAMKNWSMGIDALQLLHRLSSNPDSAGDALKLLHELQVYQVELDLQHEEISANEERLTDELEQYRKLYDAAPLGYLLLDRQHTVIRCNVAAAKCFSALREGLEGRPITSFLSSEGRSRLSDLLRAVAQSGSGGSCIADTGGEASTARQLQFLATVAPEGDNVHLACCEPANVG